ncbi:MAG: TIM barrel protein, partial [Acidobacteria bacterium]|nr:TIM barrel protein [Acidobacteriota bacterium]
SWGTLEFDSAKAEQIGFARMLDELKETGYTGTELGDWGYMPTDPFRLQNELSTRELTMLGAFVPVALENRSAHEAGKENAVKIGRLLAKVAKDPAPFLVLADNNGTVPGRTTHAGRISPEMSLSPNQWRIFADGANSIAKAVLDATGLRTVFHHHCAGYVETPNEIARLLELTDPELLGLVFDTGHYVFGSHSSDVLAGLNRFKDRIWYIHLKDCSWEVARRSREQQWDYFESLQHGVFCELGQGCVDFPGVLRWLRDAHYDGYVLVEQDVLPGMGTPRDSALRNREYLRSIEEQYESSATEVSA